MGNGFVEENTGLIDMTHCYKGGGKMVPAGLEPATTGS